MHASADRAPTRACAPTPVPRRSPARTDSNMTIVSYVNLRMRRILPCGSAGLAVPHLIERHPSVCGVLPREIQDPFADHVARHLIRAAADRDVLPGQVPNSGLEALALLPHYADRPGD